MQPTKEELEAIGTANLQWLEAQNLLFLGLPIFKVFSYELVQMLNHAYLLERLNDDPNLIPA